VIKIRINVIIAKTNRNPKAVPIITLTSQLFLESSRISILSNPKVASIENRVT